MPANRQALAYEENFDLDHENDEGDRISGPQSIERRSRIIIPEWPNAATLADNIFKIIYGEFDDIDMTRRDKREIAQAICNAGTLKDVQKIIKENPILQDVGKLLEKTPDIEDSFPIALNLIRLKLRFYVDRGLAKYYAVAGIEPF
jgi:hypothetical protein